MVIDSSALVAILLEEPQAAALTKAIAADPVRLLGVPTWVETAAVMMARKGPEGELALDALLSRLAVVLVPMTEQAASQARSAYARFGKAVGSPGVLNYGDCLAYGVARAAGEPLLFTGKDFSRTDVLVVPY